MKQTTLTQTQRDNQRNKIQNQLNTRNRNESKPNKIECKSLRNNWAKLKKKKIKLHTKIFEKLKKKECG